MLPVVQILGVNWELPETSLGERWARCLTEAVGEARRIDDAITPYEWTSRATIASIEARAGDLLMFHAAGLSVADGRVVALVGPSGTGKSTAARTLGQSGFGYVTDETVAVDNVRRVLPFPKPIAVIPADGGVKVEWGPDELGLARCPDRLILDGLILLERDSELERPETEVLHLLDAIVALVPQMSALPQLTTPLSWLASVIDACGGLHRISYREAHQLQGLVEKALSAFPVASGFRVHSSETGGEPAPGELARAEFLEALEVDGAVLVMVGRECQLLAGIGAPLWRTLTEPKSEQAALAAVIDEVGDHPRAQEMFDEAVATLESVGVLVRRASQAGRG